MRMLLKSITEEELDSLNADELVARMDIIRQTSVEERYGEHARLLLQNAPTVRQLYETSLLKKMDTITQKKALYKAFSFLLEMDLSEVPSAVANKMIYDDSYNEETTWNSSRKQIINASIKQWQIVCSRIAWENFMELLHVLGTGKSIKTKNNSKFKPFKKWLIEKDNKFAYFAFAAFRAFRFDREIRTPEVHGGSPIPRKILLLQQPTSGEKNETLDLHNTLLNLWPMLLQICNGQRPNMVSISGEDGIKWAEAFKWTEAVLHGTDDDFRCTVKVIIDSMQEESKKTFIIQDKSGVYQEIPL